MSKLDNKLKQLSPSFKIFFEILKPLKNFEKIDYKYYTTEIEKLKDRVQNRVNKLSASERKKQVEEVLKVLANTNFIKYLRRLQKDIDKRYKILRTANKNFRLLYGLLNKADFKFKNCSFLVLKRIILDELFRRCIEPRDLIEQIKTEKGEYRAKIVIRAFREVSEMLYDNYLRIVYELIFILGKSKKQPGNIDIKTSDKSFGNLIDIFKNHQLKQDIIKKYVDFDAGWIRNACSHANWKYVPKNDSLLLWDKKVTPTKIEVNILINKIYTMYDLAGPVLLEVYQIYTVKNIFIRLGFFDMCLSYLNNLKSSNDNDVLNKKFEVKFKSLFKECLKLKFVR